jgi:hypothetical protein
MYFEHIFHRRKLKKKLKKRRGGGFWSWISEKKNPNHDSRKLKFAIFENFTNNGESIRDINEGSRELKKIPHSNHRDHAFMAMEKNGERLERKKCMPCVVARVRRNCNIFNLVTENVLKGLSDKISCPDHRG